MYVYKQTSIYVCMYIHTHNTYMHAYTDMCINTHYRHTYTCKHMFMHTYMDTYMDTYIHLYVCIINNPGLSGQHSNLTEH